MARQPTSPITLYTMQLVLSHLHTLRFLSQLGFQSQEIKEQPVRSASPRTRGRNPISIAPKTLDRFLLDILVLGRVRLADRGDFDIDGTK